MKQPVKRFIDGNIHVEKREDGTKSRMVSGYAAVFNKWSHNLGWFREKIDPKAFDAVLDQDVVAVFNHDKNMILARNKKTMKLTVDAVGLRYEFEAPNSPNGDNILEAIERGDVVGSSFQFIPKSTMWEKANEADVEELRTILEVERLIDVGPVTYPAYPDSTAEADKRDFEEYQKTNQVTEPDDTETLLRELELYKH